MGKRMRNYKYYLGRGSAFRQARNRVSRLMYALEADQSRTIGRESVLDLLDELYEMLENQAEWNTNHGHALAEQSENPANAANGAKGRR